MANFFTGKTTLANGVRCSETRAWRAILIRCEVFYYQSHRGMLRSRAEVKEMSRVDAETSWWRQVWDGNASVVSGNFGVRMMLVDEEIAVMIRNWKCNIVIKLMNRKIWQINQSLILKVSFEVVQSFFRIVSKSFWLTSSIPSIGSNFMLNMTKRFAKKNKKCKKVFPDPNATECCYSNKLIWGIRTQLFSSRTQSFDQLNQNYSNSSSEFTDTNRSSFIALFTTRHE